MFEVTSGNMGGGDWEKSISSVTFKLPEKCKEIPGRMECEIEIAEGF